MSSQPSAPAPLEVLDLDPPRTRGTVSLEEALSGRRSKREFTEQSLTSQELSQLLWAAQGRTRDWGGRTAPSAGALYPLEVFAVTSDGLLHYRSANHQVEVLLRQDLRAALAQAALGQECVAQASVVLAIGGVRRRTAIKYGSRAERYVLMEAGHAVQNVLLQATVLGLGAVPVGAFDDAAVHRVLRLSPGTEPLYLVALGHSAESE